MQFLGFLVLLISKSSIHTKIPSIHSNVSFHFTFSFLPFVIQSFHISLSPFSIFFFYLHLTRLYNPEHSRNHCIIYFIIFHFFYFVSWQIVSVILSLYNHLCISCFQFPFYFLFLFLLRFLTNCSCFSELLYSCSHFFLRFLFLLRFLSNCTCFCSTFIFLWSFLAFCFPFTFYFFFYYLFWLIVRVFLSFIFWYTFLFLFHFLFLSSLPFLTNCSCFSKFYIFVHISFSFLLSISFLVSFSD